MTSPKVQPIRTPYAIANEQINQLACDLGQDYSNRLPAPWPSVDILLGPLIPGTMVVVGAKTSNGKTTFLANWFSALFRTGRKVLYVISADGGYRRLRRVLLALHCGFDRQAVMRNQWASAAVNESGRPYLSADEALKLAFEEIHQQEAWADVGMVYDAPLLNTTTLKAALRYGLDNGAEVVIVDHINRWSAKSASTETQEIGAAVKGLAGVAADKGIVVLLAAQITEHASDANPLRQFQLPPLSWLAQSSTLRNEPHAVLMLYRAIKTGVEPKDIHAIIQGQSGRSGQRQIADLLEPGVMCIGVAKDRDGSNVGRMAKLQVERTGLIVELGP